MRGDHLTVHYRAFYHHGVDCGDGTVIHLSREYGKVHRSTWTEFANGQEVYVEPTTAQYSADCVVQRAQSRLGESNYQVYANNCEHFARWCREGRAYSTQVHSVVKALSRRAPQALKYVAPAMTQVARNSAAKTAGHVVGKIAGRTAAKGVSSAVAKTLAKGGGAFLLVDSAQLLVEQCGGAVGLSQEEAQNVGKGVGAGGSALVGAAIGGPVGAAVGLAVWGIGECLGKLFD